LGGLPLSSIVMQFIAGELTFYQIMTSGNVLFIVGAAWSLVFSRSPLLLAIGFFVNSAGLGLFNGMIFRIIMGECKFSQGMTMSLLAFIQTIAMATGLEVANLTCGKLGFSLFSFSLISFLFSTIAFSFVYSFIKINKNKKWA